MPGSFAPGGGGVESIITVAVFGDSTLPAASVEKNEIVWTLSEETETLVPLCQPPPSTANWVFVTPEPPASSGPSDTVTEPDCQPLGALCPVVGAVSTTATRDGGRDRLAPGDVANDDVS